MKGQELASALEKYLDSQNKQRASYKVSDLNEVNMGWETELFTFKASHSDDVEDLVLRVFSGEGDAEKASKEFNLMRRLEEVGYPVPPVYYMELSDDVIGKPFILMRRVMGETLDVSYRSDDPEVTKKGIMMLMGLFVNLHELDSSGFKDVSNLQEIDFEYYLDYLKSVMDSYAPWLAPVVDWLDENKPAEKGKSLCHLDYHGMNVMVEEGKPYVIDWGASMICDKRMDLAWTLLLYTTFGGSQYHEPLLSTYELLSGEKVEALMYFEVAAATRRITDMVKTFGGGSAGLRSDVVELMKQQREHFARVHDFLEARVGFRLREFDALLASF
jgi:aminoglycoside phosphotransferase (APT) family kinase protein